jgi:hypothetical protein
VITVDADLDTCLGAAAESCGDDATCLADIINTCWDDAWGDWTEVLCADETLAAENPEVCSGDETDLCSDESIAALEALDEEASSNGACTQACTCQFYEDTDTDAFYSCNETCEETEPDPNDPSDADDDGYNDDCVEYYDALLNTDAIDQEAYDYGIETLCLGEAYETYFYEFSTYAPISTYDVFSSEEDREWDLYAPNDSSGDSSSAEVASSTEDHPNTLITGLVLNAYKNGGLDTHYHHLNVECVWLAWVDLKEYAETGEWTVRNDQFGFTGEADSIAADGDDRLAIDDCDGNFETQVDLSEQPGMVITGLYFDGEDCGIEAAINRRELLPAYDETINDVGSYLGAETTIEYYMNDASDEDANPIVDSDTPYLMSSVDDPYWCAENTSTTMSCMEYNDIWKEYYATPDVEATELEGDDVAIVGVGIAANNDGVRCAIDVFAEYQEIFKTETDLVEYGWEEGMTAEDVEGYDEDSDEDEDTEDDTEEE